MIWGLLHSAELETPTALAVYNHVMMARDTTNPQFEMLQLKVDTKANEPKSCVQEGLMMSSTMKFEEKTPKKTRRRLSNPSSAGNQSIEKRPDHLLVTRISQLRSNKIDAIELKGVWLTSISTFTKGNENDVKVKVETELAFNIRLHNMKYDSKHISNPNRKCTAPYQNNNTLA